MDNNDILIREEEIDCPFCCKVHTIEIRKRLTEAIVKNTVVSFIETYYLCKLTDGDNEYVPGKIMDENLIKARKAYDELTKK